MDPVYGIQDAKTLCVFDPAWTASAGCVDDGITGGGLVNPAFRRVWSKNLCIVAADGGGVFSIVWQRCI